MKQAVLAFRIAAFLSLLFAAAHTFGFLSLRGPTPASAAVRTAMDNVHFTVGNPNRSFTFGGFYVGLGLSVTCSLILLGWLSWVAGALSKTEPLIASRLGWPMTLFFVGNAVLAVRYFGPAQVASSALIALCLAWASWAASQELTP